MWDIWRNRQKLEVYTECPFIENLKTLLSQFPLHNNFSQGIYTNTFHLAPLGLSPGVSPKLWVGGGQGWFFRSQCTLILLSPFVSRNCRQTPDRVAETHKTLSSRLSPNTAKLGLLRQGP